MGFYVWYYPKLSLCNLILLLRRTSDVPQTHLQRTSDAHASELRRTSDAPATGLRRTSDAVRLR